MSEKDITSPFNPEEFRKEGHKLVDTLANYLNDAFSGKEMAKGFDANRFMINSGSKKRISQGQFYGSNHLLTNFSPFLLRCVATDCIFLYISPLVLSELDEPILIKSFSRF